MTESFIPGVHLFRAGEQVDAVETLAKHLGGRVGLAGVLGDLNRSAKVVEVPGTAAVWGFSWSDEDSRSQRWFPQGITTSADQSHAENVNGRQVVCTSWYSHDVEGVHKGSRVTFVDITDRFRPRYRHVLLVEPLVPSDGLVDVVPVKVHAGGLAWHGPYLHVAGTARGVYSFRLDDILRVYSGGDPHQLRVRGNGRVDSFGYRYVLPVRFKYDALADDGFEKLRYSFLSIDRSTHPHNLVTGEYGIRTMTTRLVSYELDPETSLLREHEDGSARPLSMYDGGVRAMQGATVVHGTYYVTTSAGRYGRGSLWVGRPGRLKRFARVLPVGPEDISYWPSTGQLWSLTEYPGRRYVFAMNRSDFG
ncbi:MAG TPA: hypothetical protein VFD59_07195 [Nocardioidaceae bacterium]|nr:hypothetical protein [Nocardioidaceae bacterium]